MIVVDSNVIAYCWIRGERTEVAQRLRLADAAWHAPVLWRSEVRSALAGHIGRGSMQPDGAAEIMCVAENAMAGGEHLVGSGAVLELVASARLSAYDCEFVALARSLSVPLVTEDRAIVKAFPDVALTMEAFLDRFPAGPPSVHQRGPRYARSRKRATDSV